MAREYELRLGTNTKAPLNGGICYNEETSLRLTQSPYNGLLNMSLDNGGTLTKRKGQAYLFPTSLGTGDINGMYVYKGETIIAHGTKLYKQTGGNDPVQIHTGLTDSKGTFFVYYGTLYFKNEGTYIEYDGTTVKNVTPYIPRISINRKPNASDSTVDESWNMLGAGFRDSFNGDGTTKDYKLSHTNLDATALKVEINGGVTTGFTVDRVTGIVTFTTAPATGNNNVVITAYKTFTDLRNNIMNCNIATEFSNRMFFSGNSSLANYYFAAGLNDENKANYFPQKYLYTVRGGDKAITGFKVHQGKLIVFKEDLICTVESALGIDNTASFPIQFLNTEIGCDIPNSIQVVNNDIMFANTYGGVFVITSAFVTGEKNVLPVSININGNYERPGLLSEADLKTATSIDYDFKYWLVVNGNAYVLDYREGYTTKDQENNKWFLYNNINANCFLIRDNELLYGYKGKGQVAKFVNTFDDFGQSINAIWKSKLIDFGYPEWLKMITNLWTTFSSKSGATITLKYFTENTDKLGEIVLEKNNGFSWTNFNWNEFSFKVALFDKTFKRKVKIKKIAYFQLEFSNNKLGEGLSIKNIVLNYRLIRKVK